MSFLVDTDICSAYMKGDHHVWQRFMQYRGQLQVSAITVGELFTWALRTKARPLHSQFNTYREVAVFSSAKSAKPGFCTS